MPNQLNNKNSDFIRIDKGLINYCDKNRVIFSRGKTIYERNSNGATKKIISLYKNIADQILCKSNLYQRLTRSHIQHVLPIKKNRILTFVSGRIYYIDTDLQTVISSSNLRGSQPLHIAKFGDTIYYGEYIRSSTKPPIHLLRSNPPYTEWQEVRRFDNIRHIHGVFRDPYDDSLWITTGDEDSESWIINLERENYQTKFIMGGSQSYRAVTLLFSGNYIYYGTDTPLEKNYIYRFKRGNERLEKLTEVGGSIFFGAKVSHNLYLSTGCEPGKFNREDAAELWESKNGKDWSRVLSLKKDIWHNKLFRYGLIFFPAGPGDDKNLWLSSMATEKDQIVLKKSVTSCQT